MSANLFDDIGRLFLRYTPSRTFLLALLLALASIWLAACSVTAPDALPAPPASYETVANTSAAHGVGLLTGSRYADRLVVFPFALSLQRHYLVKDPVFEREGQVQIGNAITGSVEKWAKSEGYKLVMLEPDRRQNQFATQRLITTSIRLLNRKGSLDKVPALPQLVDSLRGSFDYSDGAGNADGSGATTLLMAGTYSGHIKSSGQLAKERVTSAMRYAGSFGRKQLSHPKEGFGQLFVVLLDPATGRIVGYGDSNSAPASVGESLDALLFGEQPGVKGASARR